MVAFHKTGSEEFTRFRTCESGPRLRYTPHLRKQRRSSRLLNPGWGGTPMKFMTFRTTRHMPGALMAGGWLVAALTDPLFADDARMREPIARCAAPHDAARQKTF